MAKKTTDKTTKQSRRRGTPRPEDVQRPDVPYTIKLPDGRTVYVEVPGRFCETDVSGDVMFKPEGVAFLDRVRAIAMQTTDAPRPGYITAVREGLGFTQAELGERLGVDKMTVSRWERGTMKPSIEAVKKLNQLINKAKRSGVVFAA